MARRVRSLEVRIADAKDKLDRLMLQRKIQELKAKQRPRRRSRKR